MEHKLCCVCYRRFSSREDLDEHTQYHGVNWQPGFFRRAEDQREAEFRLHAVTPRTPWGREIR
jgi:hypothetical protein